ncbi:hypothetical protein [Polaromonas sp.]|uniref:hypothetical protein n=1 Tax=Polaromonas sp. TaxID=1869339 RepID=UPI0013B70CBA|nr:hypothetical protein [Polaromonas sp.]NDP62960.1 hypothetical protein [Polaromonas sp.]
MKIHRYILFRDESEGRALIDQIDQARGSDHWADPNINPFDGRSLVPWNDEYLADHLKLVDGMDSVTFDEAQDQGWSFGYFTGRFAKARIKLEEVQHIRVTLDAFDRNPNFAAYRALFFGLLSSLYGVKEALRQSSNKLGNEARSWWDAKFEEIKADPLLWLLYDLNNSDKHSISSPFLRPRMNLYVYKGPAPPGLIMSGEGVFVAVDKDTARERRVFFEGADAGFEVYLDVPVLSHKGQDVSRAGLKSQLDMAIFHYENLVFEARRTFDIDV